MSGLARTHSSDDCRLNVARCRLTQIDDSVFGKVMRKYDGRFDTLADEGKCLRRGESCKDGTIRTNQA